MTNQAEREAALLPVRAFGSALSFWAVWDGYDLMAELTRVTTLEHPAARSKGGKTG